MQTYKIVSLRENKATFTRTEDGMSLDGKCWSVTDGDAVGLDVLVVLLVGILSTQNGVIKQ